MTPRVPSVSGPQPSVASPPSSGRLVFVDVLRVFVIGWVILHHAAQPYGPTGGAWPIGDPGNLQWLAPLYPLGAAFGLGLLFFLAGYFIPSAYDRKGASLFLRERWERIGLPMILFVLVVHIPVVYFLEYSGASAGAFVRGLWDTGWRDAYLHLWFLGHLVLYSAVYTAWRVFRDRHPDRPQRTWSPPSHLAIVAFVLALAVVTWVIRGWSPIDEWLPLVFVLAAEPAHLAQYVSLFALGIVAYRNDWLNRLPTRFGAIWLGIGLVTSIGVYTQVMLASDQANDVVVGGGFTWGALLFSTLEALICAGMVIGMVVVGRRVFQRSNRLLAAMAAASYAAYILHISFVIPMQAGLEGVDISASAKFTLVGFFGILLSFGAGHVSRRIPGLRTILGTAPQRRARDAQSE